MDRCDVAVAGAGPLTRSRPSSRQVKLHQSGQFAAAVESTAPCSRPRRTRLKPALSLGVALAAMGVMTEAITNIARPCASPRPSRATASTWDSRIQGERVQEAITSSAALHKAIRVTSSPRCCSQTATPGSETISRHRRARPLAKDYPGDAALTICSEPHSSARKRVAEGNGSPTASSATATRRSAYHPWICSPAWRHASDASREFERALALKPQLPMPTSLSARKERSGRSRGAIARLPRRTRHRLQQLRRQLPALRAPQG